jgi:hypothetical protein
VDVYGSGRRAAALPAPSSARTASGRAPCIASVQNHIHLTIYSEWVLSEVIGTVPQIAPKKHL